MNKITKVFLTVLAFVVLISVSISVMNHYGYESGYNAAATELARTPIPTPTVKPTPKPTAAPTVAPTLIPTSVPTAVPTSAPTAEPKNTAVYNESGSNSDTDDTVYITNTGRKYHRSGCRYLRESREGISLSKAEARGYTPCKVCY